MMLFASCCLSPGSYIDITPLMISIIPGSLKQGERLEAKFTYVTRLSYNEGEVWRCMFCELDGRSRHCLCLV